MRIYDITEPLKHKETNTSFKGKRQIVERMLKKTEKIPSMQGYSKYNDRFFFVDGHRAFSYDTDMEMRESESPLQIESLVKKVKVSNQITISREYVEYFCKKYKGLPFKPMVIEDDGFFLGFNPKYLLDAIKFSNSEVFYYQRENTLFENSNSKNTLSSPIIQKDENGNVITLTCPVNITKQVEDYESSLDYIEV